MWLLKMSMLRDRAKNWSYLKKIKLFLLTFSRYTTTMLWWIACSKQIWLNFVENKQIFLLTITVSHAFQSIEQTIKF